MNRLCDERRGIDRALAATAKTPAAKKTKKKPDKPKSGPVRPTKGSGN